MKKLNRGLNKKTKKRSARKLNRNKQRMTYSSVKQRKRDSDGKIDKGKPMRKKRRDKSKSNLARLSTRTRGNKKRLRHLGTKRRKMSTLLTPPM
jgi:hypothetical protein